MYARACIQVLYPEAKPCDGQNERRSAHGLEASWVKSHRGPRPWESLDLFAAPGDENVCPNELGYRNSQRCKRSVRQHLRGKAQVIRPLFVHQMAPAIDALSSGVSQIPAVLV